MVRDDDLGKKKFAGRLRVGMRGWKQARTTGDPSAETGER